MRYLESSNSFTYLYTLLLIVFLAVGNILFQLISLSTLEIVLFNLILIISSLLFLFSYRQFVDKPISILQNVFATIVDSALNNEFSNYEEKIGEVDNIINTLKKNEPVFSRNFKLSTIYHNLISILMAVRRELTVAKVFKLNRNEFLGNVAHELRTPIFAIQLSLETLIDGAINDPNVKYDFLNKALSQTARMKELVSDLVNISELESGMKLKQRWFPLFGFIRGVLKDFIPVAENKNIKIELSNNVNIEEEVFADEDKIRQVLINLLDNAVKYSNQNSRIILRLAKKGNFVSIAVQDFGIGIPESDLPRIFERFYRVDKNRSREMGGSGLGLSIVKHILELHNAKINVTSRLNEGSTFEFTLPVRSQEYS
ncbi:MAG: sensor histidine kinase [Ignavibacteria bacterium]